MGYTVPERDEYTSSASCTVLCDWGGSRLRAYLQLNGEIVARSEGPGIGGLKGPAIASLHEVLTPWGVKHAFDRIVMCGMVGSRNGIVEVPYARIYSLKG